ncbi:Fc.00g056770.m01.CDS01 [Cosmosporella sp. VM-42]
MIPMGNCIIRCLAAALLLAGINVQAHPAAESLDSLNPLQIRATFREDFKTFNTDIWACEYTCPVIETSKARFRLQSGTPPDESGSWSKARYKPTRFTSGRFTVSFSLTDRPKQAVWWGVALWDDGPASNGKEFNEINFGYTTDESFTNTKLLFESARNGKVSSIPVDTGIDLYDEEYHTATLEYNSSSVAFYLDGNLLKEITDKSVIPIDPMDLVLGPRLVTGSNSLAEGFTESIDWVEISY